MRHVLLAGVAFVALGAASAMAADLPIEPAPMEPAYVPEAVMTWTGLYIGAHAGYTFSDNDDEVLLFDFDGDGDFDDTILTGAGANAFSPGFESDSDDGFEFGGRVGYDYQFGSFVVGALIDLSYMDIETTTTGFSTTPAFYTFERDLEWLATGRLRAGFAADRFLVYATGGVAYGSFDESFTTDTPASIDGTFGGDDDEWGYTVGAGVEAKVTDNISVGLEYLYTNFDESDFGVTLSGPGAPGGPFGAGTDIVPSDGDFDFHTVRANVNFRFSTGGY